MVTLSFVLSAGIGAVAGCVMSPITYSDYEMGPSLAIKGFTVAILGGLGNSVAAVTAGLLLGIIEAFSVSILPLAFQDAIATSILLIILFLRPHGLFGSSEAAGLKEF
jgi:branched-chain amino acid transport system permease protein